MARIDGVEPDRVTDEYTARVLAAQAKACGAPLLNHLVYARRPTIFRGARGMWAGIDGSGLIDGVDHIPGVPTSCSYLCGDRIRVVHPGDLPYKRCKIFVNESDFVGKKRGQP